MKDEAAADGGMKFEEALKRLEAIVKEMEEGRLDLDALVGRFEEGQKLVRFCSGKLEEVQRRIEILTRGADGQPRAELFDAATDGGESVETDDSDGEVPF